jgi:hypothetical protein
MQFRPHLRSLLPQSLRRQFFVALSALALLAVAGGLVALYALRVAVNSTQQLAGERLVQMQASQELVQKTLLIERETYRMLEGQSIDVMRLGYEDIIERLGVIDALVGRLVTGNDDINVLALHQASQLFRNTTSVVASLRESVLQTESVGASRRSVLTPIPKAERQAQLENIRHFHQELQFQASDMAAAAQGLSVHFTESYRDAIDQVVMTSQKNERWVLVLLLGNLVFAWLVTKYLIGRKVLSRLAQVSHYLRSSDSTSSRQRVPVEGSDEIALMARAVELFLEDRRQLALANVALEDGAAGAPLQGSHPAANHRNERGDLDSGWL